MRKLLYIFMLFVLAQVVGSCMPGDKTVILQTAEAVLYEQPDSALKLLSQIEYPKTLPHSQLMRYGWIQAYAHYACGISMSREDSLILPAADYFSAQGDSAKLPGIYLAKAVYYQWKQQYGKMETALDTAYLIASRQQDSMALFNLYNYKGYIYTQLKKDHAHGAKYLKEALRYHQEPDIYFSLGICLALDGIKRHATPSQTDSASYYMNKAIEWALSKEDTVRACHYMRNYAQILTSYRRSQEAIELAKRTLPLTTHGQHHKVLLYSCIGENYLKEGNLDSAQHYITLANKENPTFVTTKNAVAQYQMIIDYARTKNFDNITIGRYNDSIGNALKNEKNTIYQKNQSKILLEKERLQTSVEKQHTQMVLLTVLFASALCAGAVALYIRNRRHKLIETQERIEALTRLLNDATRNEKEGVEDEHFFKKILLQQLGIIRMVAAQPTTQNQEMLRRISGISNKEIPAESLLVWEDLYPLIDRIYNGFYTSMNRKFGKVLSEKELQLCCLLCAEFSTKEISVVTQQSVPTIYQRKTTVRKKLHMGEKEDIIEFIKHSLNMINSI